MNSESVAIPNPSIGFTKVPLQIWHISTAQEAFEALSQKACPVECSFGDVSVVDALQMDHHGSLSHLEGVGLRAYRDQFGVRRSDPRFVVTGAADADATFAIAALAGLLPHPSRAIEFLTAPISIRNAWSHNFTSLAELINRADADPIGLRLDGCEDGLRLLLFKQLSSGVQDVVSFYAGVDRWRRLLGPNPPTHLLETAHATESDRLAAAHAARFHLLSEDVAFVESSVWGYDVWYSEVRPVIVSYQATEGRVSVGCRDLPTATRIFGPGGLRAVFPHLQPSGWGGRETIGGSPRDVRLNREQSLLAARLVAGVAQARMAGYRGCKKGFPNV